MKFPAFKSIPKYGIALLFTALANGCTTAPPTQEMSDARQAIRAAKQVVTGQSSSRSVLAEAEDLLHKAEHSLSEGDYGSARDHARKAKTLAIQIRELAVGN